MSDRPASSLRSRGCVLLLDENTCSQQIADPANQLRGWTVERFKAHLEKGTPDEDVVAFCGPRGWGLVTLDEMRYSHETKIAIVAHEVRVFRVVTRKHTVFAEVQAALIVAQQQIRDIIARERKALVAHVRLGGDVNIISRLEEYREMYTESRLKTTRRYGPKIWAKSSSA